MEKPPRSEEMNLYYGDGTICAAGAAILPLAFCLFENITERMLCLGMGGILMAIGVIGGLWHLDAEFGRVKLKRNGPFWIAAARIVLFILIGMVLFFLRSWVGSLTIFIAVWTLFRLKIMEMEAKTQTCPAKEERRHAEAEKQRRKIKL